MSTSLSFTPESINVQVEGDRDSLVGGSIESFIAHSSDVAWPNGVLRGGDVGVVLKLQE